MINPNSFSIHKKPLLIWSLLLSPPEVELFRAQAHRTDQGLGRPGRSSLKRRNRSGFAYLVSYDDLMVFMTWPQKVGDIMSRAPSLACIQCAWHTWTWRFLSCAPSGSGAATAPCWGPMKLTTPGDSSWTGMDGGSHKGCDLLRDMKIETKKEPAVQSNLECLGG